jgi:hypothetical protein
MGIYVRACWAEPKRYVWTRRQWDKGYEECVNKQNPVGSWPNYGITGLPEHLWR